MGCIHPFLHYKDITSICGAVDETWQTIDVSDYVPAQTKYVLLYIKNPNSQDYFNVRPTGSGYNDEPDVGHPPRIYHLQQKFIIIKLNDDREFDMRRSNAGTVVYITGWVDGSIHYLNARIDVTPVANGAWEETDLSAYIPENATGAYFYWVNSIAAGRSAGARENGSTNGNYFTVHRSTKWFACGVDEDRKVQLYKQDANITIYLIGYFVAPMDFLLNKNQTPQLSGNNNWVDVDLTGKFPTNNIDFAFISMFPCADNEGIAPRGGTGYATAYGKQRGMGFVRVDTNCQIRGYTFDRTNQLHYCEGYQETDTSRYQLGIDANRPDDYPESDIEYGSTVWGIRWLRKCFIHNGLFWVFYVKQDVGISGNFYYRTSSDGENWSTETLIRNVIYMYGESAHICFDGSKIHIFTKNTPILNYRKGTPETDGTITWDANWQTVFAPAPNPTTVGDHSGAVDSDGYPWVAWCYENASGGYGAMEIHVNGSQNNDGTWLDLGGYPQDLTNGTVANNYRMAYLVALLDRNIYTILFKGGSPPKGRFYTQSTDTWGAVESISSRNAKTLYNANAYELWSISAVVDTIGHIHLVFLDEDNNIVYCRRDYHLDTWITSDEVILKTNVPDYATPQIAIDYATGNLFVYYMKADEHIYMLRHINWIWDADWIDFLDMSDVGVGHDNSDGDDGCISVSRRIINDNIIVLAMGDSPRIIRHKIREVDKTNFTWDEESRPTPWKQSCIRNGTIITAVMPSIFDGIDWLRWDDNETSRSRNIVMDADYLHIGVFMELPSPQIITEVITKGKISKPWIYEYFWNHIPSEKVRAIIKRFTFGETKTIKGSFTLIFTETKKIRAKIGNIFSETRLVSSTIIIPFRETQRLIAGIEKKFEETCPILAIVYSKWFVERLKIFAETESLERNILDELKRIEESEE